MPVQGRPNASGGGVPKRDRPVLLSDSQGRAIRGESQAGSAGGSGNRILESPRLLVDEILKGNRCGLAADRKSPIIWAKTGAEDMFRPAA